MGTGSTQPRQWLFTTITLGVYFEMIWLVWVGLEGPQVICMGPVTCSGPVCSLCSAAQTYTRGVIV